MSDARAAHRFVVGGCPKASTPPTHATAASAPPASVLEALERARAACAGDDQAADTLSTWIEMMRDTSATLREGERQLESHMQRCGGFYFLGFTRTLRVPSLA